jgi:uncharacterized protein YukE
MSIEMDPAGVRRAGGDLTQVAETARSRTANLLRSSADAAAGNPGWSSAEQLKKAHLSWRQQVGKLIDETGGAAQNLRDSADRVSVSDQEGEDRLLRVLHEMAGEPTP